MPDAAGANFANVFTSGTLNCILGLLVYFIWIYNAMEGSNWASDIKDSISCVVEVIPRTIALVCQRCECAAKLYKDE